MQAATFMKGFKAIIIVNLGKEVCMKLLFSSKYILAQVVIVTHPETLQECKTA